VKQGNTYLLVQQSIYESSTKLSIIGIFWWNGSFGLLKERTKG